jgi:HPt (histidine-containing phosphotransfer) domain-containing protein
MLLKLAEIESLDSFSAIKNLNGKSNMYLDLVIDFYTQYKDFSLENSLIEGTFSNDIHSLKSNSDYIGATKISLYCSILQVEVFNKNVDSKIFKCVIKEINDLIDDLDEILY